MGCSWVQQQANTHYSLRVGLLFCLSLLRMQCSTAQLARASSKLLRCTCAAAAAEKHLSRHDDGDVGAAGTSQQGQRLRL